MKTLDKEMIGICGLIALIAALGVVASTLVFTGVTIENCNSTLLAAAYCSLSGIIWGILLIFNI